MVAVKKPGKGGGLKEKRGSAPVLSGLIIAGGEVDLPLRKDLRKLLRNGKISIGGEHMYRRTNTQRSLFEVGTLMPEGQREACRRSWAGPFREKALPILLKCEDDFAELFHPEEGRPNRPVALVVGTLLLKEMSDLTDEEVLGDLDFDTRLWYAFDVEVGKSHLCQKTPHNFRAGLMKHDKSRLVFRGLTDELIRALGIDVTKQRLDSTHILSNIAVLTRLGLFRETLRVFLVSLKKADAKRYAALPLGILKRHGEESRYADARKAEGPRRLAVVARDAWRLAERFRGDTSWEYKLLERLVREQCAILPMEETPRDDEDDHGDGPVPVKLKAAKEVESSSLQTPHDEDVTYSGHKGKGYETQIAETCHPDNAVEIITHVAVTPSCGSDASATVPTVEALESAGIKPEELVADTSYSGSKNAVEAAARGVNLLAPCPAKGKPEGGKEYPAPAPQCPTTKEDAGDWLKRQEAQKDFGKRYAIRAGIEGTNSEMKRRHGLGHLRVRGGKRVRLAVYLKTAACNLKRALCYWRETAASAPPMRGSGAPGIA